MKIERNCKVCTKKFTAIKSTQWFCQRKCFKRDYYLRKKEEMAEEVRRPKYPSMNCSVCNMRSELDFDPVRYPKRFEEHKCPHCEFSRPNHWLTNTHFVFAYTRVVVEEGMETVETVIQMDKRPF